MAKATQALINLVNTYHQGPALPIYTTEHASKTASSWNLASSSSDDYYEAARLACQLTCVPCVIVGSMRAAVQLLTRSVPKVGWATSD